MITLAMAQAWWTAAALFHQPRDLSDQGGSPAWCTTCGTAWPCVDAASLLVKLSTARHRVRSHRQPTSPLFKAFALMTLWTTAPNLTQTETPIPMPAPSAQTGPTP